MPRVNREWFDTLLDAKVLIERWRRAYNTVRLRSFSPKSQCREPLRRIG